MNNPNANRLLSAEERHAQNPEGFWIPDKRDRDSLQPGDTAKVIFKTYTGDSIGGERIWIEVTGRVGDKYIGKLGNTPSLSPASTATACTSAPSTSSTSSENELRTVT
jgi:hypothetical protein